MHRPVAPDDEGGRVSRKHAGRMFKPGTGGAPGRAGTAPRQTTGGAGACRVRSASTGGCRDSAGCRAAGRAEPCTSRSAEAEARCTCRATVPASGSRMTAQCTPAGRGCKGQVRRKLHPGIDAAPPRLLGGRDHRGRCRRGAGTSRSARPGLLGQVPAERDFGCARRRRLPHGPDGDRSMPARLAQQGIEISRLTRSVSAPSGTPPSDGPAPHQNPAILGGTRGRTRTDTPCGGGF